MNQGTCPECGAVMTEGHHHSSGDTKMDDMSMEKMSEAGQMACPDCGVMVNKEMMTDHAKTHQGE